MMVEDADDEVDDQESDPPELPLDHQPERPEEDHVADEVEDPRVQEVIRQPLHRVHAVAHDEHVVVIGIPGEDEE
jgi:hypothetical protein